MKKLKFDSINEFNKKIKKRKTCIFQGCGNKSIKKSHTIQKSGSLKVISNESHLLHPVLDVTANELIMKMVKIGIGDASTFPGFCEKHEKIFSKFEERKDIDSVEEATLQAYRSICREIVINKIELERVNKGILKYKNERNRHAKLILQNQTLKKVESVKVEYDDYRINFAKMSKSKLTDKINFLTNIHDKFLAIMNNKDNDNIFMEVIKIDIRFPVALSGIGYANIMVSENNIREVKSVLNIIPFESSTILIFVGDINDKDILQQHIERVSQHPFLILNFIESFMMHGTDHWFVNPKIWNDMDDKKKRLILEYLFITKKSFMDAVDFSFFDSIRKDFLEKFPISENFKENEISKLNFELIDNKKNLIDSMIERYNNFYSKDSL